MYCVSITRPRWSTIASNEGNLLEQQLWQVSFAGERKQLSAGAWTSRGQLCSQWRRICRQAIHAADSAGLEPVRGAGKCNVFWQTTRAGTLPPACPEAA
jgi:hypothetical protein